MRRSEKSRNRGSAGSKRRSGAALLGALFFGLVAAALVAFVSRQAALQEVERTTPAQARAIGSIWRAEKSDALARKYARALLAAGLHDELDAEIRENGLLANDAPARRHYLAESHLRERRYSQAVEIASGDASDPFLAFVRARAGYALAADWAPVADDVSTALRGPKELAAEAWLFRARIALDANEFAIAEAAARRAVESGADQARADLVAIEVAVRQGDFSTAATRLAARAAKKSGVGEDLRLAAIIRIEEDDAWSALRLLETAKVEDASAPLLAAYAKWRAGDIAQAYAIVDAELAAAPENWAALDLAAAIAHDFGRARAARDYADRLFAARPALAIIRILRRDGDLDGAYARLAGLPGAGGTTGVGAMLLGAAADLPQDLRELDAQEESAIALARALAGGDAARLRVAVRGAAYLNEPLLLTLGGEATARLGDLAQADEFFARATVLAPDFFAPVRLRAAQASDKARAISILQEFAESHPDHAGAAMTLGAVAAAAGEAALATQAYERVDPERLFADEVARLAYIRAAHAVGGERLDRAIMAAEAHAPSQEALGLVHLAAGDDARAIAPLRKALIGEAAGDSTATAYLEAMSRLGRAEEAQSLLSEIERKRNGDRADLEDSRAGDIGRGREEAQETPGRGEGDVRSRG